MSIYNSDGTLNFDVEVLKGTIFREVRQQEASPQPLDGLDAGTQKENVSAPHRYTCCVRQSLFLSDIAADVASYLSDLSNQADWEAIAGQTSDIDRQVFSAFLEELKKSEGNQLEVEIDFRHLAKQLGFTIGKVRRAFQRLESRRLISPIVPLVFPKDDALLLVPRHHGRADPCGTGCRSGGCACGFGS